MALFFENYIIKKLLTFIKLIAELLRRKVYQRQNTGECVIFHLWEELKKMKEFFKELKEKRKDYRAMIDFCCDSLILNNYIVQELQKMAFTLILSAVVIALITEMAKRSPLMITAKTEELKNTTRYFNII